MQLQKLNDAVKHSSVHYRLTVGRRVPSRSLSGPCSAPPKLRPARTGTYVGYGEVYRRNTAHAAAIAISTAVKAACVTRAVPSVDRQCDVTSCRQGCRRCLTQMNALLFMLLLLLLLLLTPDHTSAAAATASTQ